VVYLHINRERDFWYSSGIMGFPIHGLYKAGGSGTIREVVLKLIIIEGEN